MEITEFMHTVQLLSQEAGLAVNTNREEVAKEKLRELYNLLASSEDVIFPDEPDKGPAAGEADPVVLESSDEETPAEPGPEAQPSEE